MADYHSPTVVRPSIPASAITGLELALLTAIFEHEPDGDALYFYASEGPPSTIWLDIADLKDMLAEEAMPSGPIVEMVRTGIMKAQIDHLPLEFGGMRPTQGRTLAVMQVSGGSQSFNAVNTLRLLGRWMRMITIPNQSSVAMAFKEFDEAGRMRPSSYYDRIVDVMEELVRFTILTRPHADQLVDRYSERKAAQAKRDAAADLASRALG